MRGDPVHGGSSRWDSFPLGFVLGLFFPVLGFFVYATIYVTAIRPHHDLHWFVYDLFLGTTEYRSQVLSLSLIADAVPFFIFDRFGRYKSMRGVIGAMLVYAAAVIIFLF
jgi:hypothetical protein